MILRMILRNLLGLRLYSFLLKGRQEPLFYVLFCPLEGTEIGSFHYLLIGN
jgi:hypothetical protein